MKKLIAMIIGSLYAVFCNLSPVAPKEMPYLVDSEYYISDQEEINYKQLYEMYNAVGGSDSFCKKETYNSSKDNDKLVVNSPYGNYRYWVQPGKEYIGEGITEPDDCVATFDDGEQLIAPVNGTIVTPPFSQESQEGNLRIQTNDSYILEFINLKCWYCCAHKEEPDNGVYIHNGPDYPPKGHLIEAGKVIGVATKETKLNIYMSSGGKLIKVTYDDFFIGKENTE